MRQCISLIGVTADSVAEMSRDVLLDNMANLYIFWKIIDEGEPGVEVVPPRGKIGPDPAGSPLFLFEIHHLYLGSATAKWKSSTLMSNIKVLDLHLAPLN